MRWTLIQKFALLLIAILLSVAIFAIVMKLEINKMSEINHQLFDEWTELSYIITLRNELPHLSSSLLNAAGKSSEESMKWIDYYLTAARESIDGLKYMQSSQLGAAEAEQESEWDIIKKLEYAINRVEVVCGSMKGSDKIFDRKQAEDLAAGIIESNDNLEQFLSIEKKEMRDSLAEVEKTKNKIGYTFAFLILSLAIILMFLCLGFYFGVIRPIRDLHFGVKRLAKRDYRELSQANRGDEVGELAVAFNRMAKEIENFTGDLERQIEERTHELHRSQHLAGIGQLAAGVAHEINNPLATIRICTDGLLRRLEDNPGGFDGKQTAEYLKTMRDEVHRCKDIIEKLLDFSKQKTAERQPHDALRLVQEIVGLAQHSAEKNGCEFSLHLPEGPIDLVCDENQIKQVLLNLLMNAVDASKQGDHIAVSLSETDNTVVVSVQDSGVGIAEEDMDHIFEPFFSRKTEASGIGLGLSVSHGIVESHQGKIRVESQGLGQGAFFEISLPKQQANSTSKKLS